jgi:hypothetical protein
MEAGMRVKGRALVPLTMEMLARPDALMRVEVDELAVLLKPAHPPVVDPYAYVLTVAGTYWGVGTPAGFC